MAEALLDLFRHDFCCLWSQVVDNLSVEEGISGRHHLLVDRWCVHLPDILLPLDEWDLSIDTLHHEHLLVRLFRRLKWGVPAGQGIPRILKGGLHYITHEVREVEVLDTCRVRVNLIVFLRLMTQEEVLTWIWHFVLVENAVLEKVIQSLTAFGKRPEFREVLILNASLVNWCPLWHSNSTSRSLGCS